VLVFERVMRNRVAMPVLFQALQERRSLRALAAIGRLSALASILVLFALVTGGAAEDGPVDQAGARFMSYRSLREAPEKFDAKAIWVVGSLTFRAGTVYLGEAPGTTEGSNACICLEPVESMTDPTGSARIRTMRRLVGLSVGVHGRYQRAPSSKCPNGTIFAALLDVSLE